MVLLCLRNLQRLQQPDCLYYTGRHLSEYERYVNAQLSRIQRRYDVGRISDGQLLNEVGRVEGNIRSALLNRQVRLQHADPN